MDAALPVPSLVARARAGDRAAFCDLHRRFARPVFLFLAGLLRRREDAEDAWQVAFLSAWRHLPRLREPEQFSSWLFRIARNAAHDVAERRRRWPGALPPGEDLLAACPPAGEGVADEAPVGAMLSTLEPQTRALVLLRAVQGWSAEDVGAAMSWSVATVRRRYARALSLLRARIETRGAVGAEAWRPRHVP
ncbi:MAG: sigma-70 family RNA polymerase sigma factor [Planctomycetes bacterium]|nr:sigma-70 family RNA polymerase sigma factor [Planctomycetota bacterium]